MINIDELKKKIIYRSNYRGTKEMDKLLGAFTKKYLDQLNGEDLNQLIQLDKFINLDDEILKSLKNKELKYKIDEDLINILQKFEKF